MKSIFLIGAMLLLLCAGLFGAGKGEAAAEAPELIVQLMADSAPDIDMVTDAINEILLKKLNCTVKFQNLTWTDWRQKYKLLLTSGEKIDLLYAANWNNYADYSRDGAYIQLDDLVPEVTPELWKVIPKADWDGVKIDGKIFAVPDLFQSYSAARHIMYREDLRKKYGAPKIVDLETAEKYYDAIKANEPSMFPVNAGQDAWLSNVFTYLVAKANPGKAWESFQWNAVRGSLYLDYRNPRTALKTPWEHPQYMEFLGLVRRWAQKGFWSEDILSEKNPSQDLVEAGKSAACAGMNVGKAQKYIERIRKNNPNWEIDEFSWDKARGFSIPAASQQDITTIPLQSKYPEKGLQVTEAFLLDKDLQFLVHYGIQGTHYEVSANNEYKQLPGSKGYGIFGMNGWAWKNSDLLLKQIGGWGPESDAYIAHYDSIAVPNFGFAVNQDSIKAEMTGLVQVVQQYGWPLWSGLVEDYKKGQETFEQKLKESGFEKVRGEIQKQFLAYLEEIGR